MKKIMILAIMMASLQSIGQTRAPLVAGAPLPAWFDKLQSPYKGKYLIMDLFNSGCAVCFSRMPKVNAFQHMFKDKVTFLLVGEEDKYVRNIYQRVKEKNKLDLNVVFDSTIFRKSEISFVPRYLWVDKKGILIAVTGPDNVDTSNIEAFIHDKPIDRTGEDRIYSNASVPMEDDNFLFRTVLTRWVEPMQYRLPVSPDYPKNDSSFQALGITMERLYKYAYFGRFFWEYGDSLYGKVSADVVMIDDASGSIKNSASEALYCYSVFTRGGKLHSFREPLRSDLYNYFGYEVEIRKRKLPCWKLTVDSNARAALLTRGGKPIYESGLAGIDMQNRPMKIFVKSVADNYALEPPFIDCTGITGNIDIKMDVLMRDLEDVRKALRQKGLNLEKGEIEIQQLVLHHPKLVNQ